MEHHIQSGSKNPRVRGIRGYTLIELIIVMAIISILMAIAIPQYQKSIRRTKETLLHSNIQTLRTVIDEYTFDKKKAPQTLNDLVAEGYLRAIPIDPIMGNVTPLYPYDPGTWGPDEANQLIANDGPWVDPKIIEDDPCAKA